MQTQPIKMMERTILRMISCIKVNRYVLLILVIKLASFSQIKSIQIFTLLISLFIYNQQNHKQTISILQQIFSMKTEDEKQRTVKDIMKQENEVQFLAVNRYEVEENAIFIDFKPQQLKKTISDYPNLKFFHRLSLSKNIPAIEETCQQPQFLYDFLLQLAKDHEDIQRQLLQFYKTLLKHLGSEKKSDYKPYFIDPLMILVQGTHLQVKQEASLIISLIKHWVTAEQKKEIIKIAIEMIHNNDEQNKIVSIQLIARLTPDMTNEENQIFFSEQYTKLYNDSSVRVKKQIITELKVLGANVSVEFLDEKILEKFYLEKCMQKVWGVRKACVQIISHLVKLTNTKKQELAAALIAFTKDGNKIVKVSAFKVLPEFLANYQSENMPAKLMQIYLKLMDHQINSLVSRQNEIINKVSFFFPGVLYRAGKKSWNDMRKLFERLINHRHQEVKKPIASSLHEISSIIGPQLSKQYMFAALDTILKDKSDSLKLEAISHLSEFVKLFDTTTRQNLIDVFLVLQKDPKKWRVRYSIAQQLEELSKIYETETIFKYIFPISLKLCNDNVSQVRMEASKQIYYIINSLKSIQQYQQMAIESIKGFGVSAKFVQRQTFSNMVETMYKLPNFKERFNQLLQELSKDPVITVRITLAISISKARKKVPAINKDFQKIIKQLKRCQQVAQYLQDQENQEKKS